MVHFAIISMKKRNTEWGPDHYGSAYAPALSKFVQERKIIALKLKGKMLRFTYGTCIV